MATVFKYTPTQVTNESLRIDELRGHPNWKGELKSIELNQGSYAIVKESDPNHFCLLWLNNKGEKVSVLFWIDHSTFQWCFQNGQAHISNNLNDTIAHIFKHFKEKDA
ncbi:MAG: hypothetical protein ACRDFB_06815 [Rhabdochlamydiaceae bacterium]